MSITANNCVLGWQNAIDGGVLTANSAELTMPVTMLRDPHGASSNAWQTVDGVLTAWVQSVPDAPVAWRAVLITRSNLTDAATLRVRLGAVDTITSAPAYDSGVLTPGVVRGQAVHLLPAAVTAAACRIDITDTANPDNHINIPLIYAGPAWQMLTNISRESASAMQDGARRATARGGQQHVEPAWIQRRWELRLDNFRSSDGEARVLELERVARAGTSILCIPRPATQPHRDAVFGLAEGFTRLGFGSGSGQLRSIAFTVTERL